MTIRLHPATAHGDRLHRLMSVGRADQRTATTFCGVRFAWGDWKGRSREPLPRCSECFLVTEPLVLTISEAAALLRV